MFSRGVRLVVRWFAANAVFGFQVAVFALVFLVASPVLLFKFGVDWVRKRIESRWPGSYRAQEVSFWVGLLAPVILDVVLLVVLVVLWFAVARLQVRQDALPSVLSDD